MKPAWYKRQRDAEKLAKRVRAAWLGKEFEVVQCPHDFKWGVARIVDGGFRIHSWVAKPKGPLPGEPGHIPLIKWQVEYTDTFGGVANYSWVNKKELSLRSNLTNKAVMQRARKAMGLTGKRGTTYWYGDCGEFKPYRMATVLAVSHSGTE